MTDIVAPILETLNAHPELGGLITFLISAGESVAIIGTIVPGSITMTAIGALAGAGILPLYSTLIWAILGAIVGDGISYWIGHHFKSRLHRIWPFRNHPSLLKTGEVFFHKHGGMSVFIGRFVGPVRALVPLVAGMLGMRPLVFYIANIASAILWAPAYMLPGILLGAAALELPPDIALHVVMVFIFIILIGLLCLWFIYKLFQLVQKQTDQLKNWIWYHLEKSRYFSVATIILKHYDHHKTHGQLRLAIYFFVVCLMLGGLIIYVKATGSASITINDAMYHLFRGIRNPTADVVMLNITLLGQRQIILPAAGLLFFYLLFKKRFWTALHVIELGILAAGAVFVTKHLVQSHRPWGILQPPDSFSFPSGHTTMATIAFMGLAFLLAASLSPKRRWPIYLAAILIALAVGVSRMYLGAHWFTDVLGAWLLGAAVLIFVIISFRRKREATVSAGETLLMSFAALAVTFSVYHHFEFNTQLINYTELDWPKATIAINEWWEKNNMIPAYRVSLFGFPSQKINIEWNGDINHIRKTLMKQGWEKPPARNWISTLHRMADISSTEYLPMVSPQYLDNKPELILTREIVQDGGKKQLLVLRLWNSSRTIKENNHTLWVGVVGIVPRSYSWLYHKHPGDIEIDSLILFPKQKPRGWALKSMTMNQPTGTKHIIRQNVILIRPNRN